MTTIVTEAATVETVQPGDEIRVRDGYRLVAETNVYDDGAIVIVYFDRESSSYENKARDKSGHNSRHRLTLKSLATMHVGDQVDVIRGSRGAALTERARLEKEQREHAEMLEERWRRGAASANVEKATRRQHSDPLPETPPVKPRSYMCLCGHAIGEHALNRAQGTPGSPYHWRACTVDGCTCWAAKNETGTIDERNGNA